MMKKEKLESLLNEESTSRDDWKSCGALTAKWRVQR
jgi:hypothetical protein